MLEACVNDKLNREKKTNKEVLRVVKKKCTSMDVIRTRRWKMIEHALRRPEELHNLIIESIIEGKRTTVCPQNSYYLYRTIEKRSKSKKFQGPKRKYEKSIE